MAKSISKKGLGSNIIIVEKMRDYSNDPLVKRKAKEAREFIQKHGLPKFPKKKK
jgi:hypothetical protein